MNYWDIIDLHLRPLICTETRNRIIISVAAYAYDFDIPIMSDAEFDDLARSINLSSSTSRPDLDQWFRANFSTDTGMWIHKHPELASIESIYNTVYRC